jgi:hypothetical protein
MKTETIRKVGDKVFDMPSQQIVTILEVAFGEDEEAKDDIYYGTDAPPDATGDGAFPTGWRNYFEVCDPDKTLPLDY